LNSTQSALDFIERVTLDEKFADLLNRARSASEPLSLAKKEEYNFTL